MNTIKILIADDHTIVREGLHSMLELEEDFEVVGEARNGREAIHLAVDLLPHVILMDISMPQMNGLEATRQIVKAIPMINVLILSGHNDDAYVQKAIDSGARGYMIKQISIQNVCKAIRQVHAGKRFFSPSISERIKRLSDNFFGELVQSKYQNKPLTSREVEILQLVAEGRANKQMAAELMIGIKTVEKHREHLMAKLDIHETAGLTRYAIRTGIVESCA
ncbi:MAG: response regulator transcription factor [Blastochloris sp.]|jgi:DNA-binding NarL/FixJ family response regulator|nr:response regulator transcription factor [Blastochloris sp.]